MIYLVRISTQYIGAEELYLCHEEDTDEDIRGSEHIRDSFLSYVGLYPTVEELMEENDISEGEAHEQLEMMVQDDLQIERTKASLKDIETIPIFPTSIVLYEDCEEMRDYREYIEREENINELLS